MVQEAYIQGVSARSVDDLVQAMGMAGISKSQVSGLCSELDEKVQALLNRPLEGNWPYLWLDATYVKVRQAGGIISVAVIIAVGVNDDGRREVMGMTVGASEAETFWTDFLCSFARRSLRSVKLAVSDALDGLEAAVAKVLHAIWQRCRVHTMRNLLAHAGAGPGRGRRLPRHRLRPEQGRRCQGPVAQGRRSAPPQATETGRSDGRGRDRCAVLHGLPRRALDQAAFHQRPGMPRWRGQTTHRCRRHLPQ